MTSSLLSSLWGQIMQQLRQGIKLKKVSQDKTPAEFALTPYEMLMDDIRGRKYKLNHVEVEVEAVKTDARDKILEFIRSRPPLKPAGERRLKPRRKESTAREIILETIRDPAGGQQALKKINRRPSTNNLLEEMKKKRRHGVISEESPLRTERKSSRPTTRLALTGRSRTSLSLLSLTVSEVAHIRAELTKAQLEDKNLPAELLSNISQGKICFVCMTVRFGVMNWSYPCSFCKKSVRTKYYNQQ